jgi:SAM-dependent methyltransferase
VTAGAAERLPAELYDAFYDALGKDYRAEARTVLRLARALGARPRSLLDVACGTGRHVEQLSSKLRRVGVDIDSDMLSIAARRCPGARFVQGDMVDFDLADRFDVVTCLFSSIAYVRTMPRLRRAVRCMAAHVAPGGVLVIEPWYRPDTWDADGPGVDRLVLDEPDRNGARICRSSRRGDLSVLDLDYLVADAAGTHRYRERHELRLFETEHYIDAFEAAGLETTVDEYGLWGHGLILGVAPR